jgi:hypothetical protein
LRLKPKAAQAGAMDAETALGPDALDFWIGSWRVTWPGGTGTNEISRILDDRVIEEVFEVVVDGRISFQRSSPVDGGDVLQRMVWLDVTDDGFRWEWQRSEDGGATWQVSWPLDYRRAPAS